MNEVQDGRYVQPNMCPSGVAAVCELWGNPDGHTPQILELPLDPCEYYCCLDFQ